MGIYSENNNMVDEDFGINMDALVEAFLIDDLTHNYPDETVHEFCAPGGVAEALLAEGKIFQNKSTVFRLNKESELERRKAIAAIMMAKAKNDPQYAKLVKYKALYKQAKAKIVEKYDSRAAKAAIKGQKEYVKKMRGVNVDFTGRTVTEDPNR